MSDHRGHHHHVVDEHLDEAHRIRAVDAAAEELLQSMRECGAFSNLPGNPDLGAQAVRVVVNGRMCGLMGVDPGQVGETLQAACAEDNSDTVYDRAGARKLMVWKTRGAKGSGRPGEILSSDPLVVACGTEYGMTPMTVSAFARMGALSPNPDPNTSSDLRPIFQKRNNALTSSPSRPEPESTHNQWTRCLPGPTEHIAHPKGKVVPVERLQHR